MKFPRALFIAPAVVAVVFFSACGGSSNGGDASTPQDAAAPSSVGSRPLSPDLFADATPGADGLKIVDETTGSGPAAKSGDVVTVDYLGTFTNGEKFDASADHGSSFQFVLGQGNVIHGWDEGIVGMQVGGVRLLYVPYQLGYGSSGYGAIPPATDLLFEVKLEKIGQ